MRCPFKFNNYEFEGGQECIGSECGMHKLCNANDAPPEGTFQVSHDCGSTFSPPVKIQGEQDTRDELEADALALVDNLRMYGGKYAGDAEVEIIGMLDRQAAIANSECRSEFDALDEHAQALERENAKQRKHVDNLAKELKAVYNALARAEHDNATLRENLGRMLDNADWR